jgi:hypothetical protein
MPLDLQLGDVLTLKKPHACGENAWEIYRLGADIGLRCGACKRLVMLPRVKLERRIRLVRRGAQTFKPQAIKRPPPDEEGGSTAIEE